MKDNEATSPLIFNLGRIWQSALCGDWREAERVCDFTIETGCSHAGLTSLKKPVRTEDIDHLDKVLNKITGW